MITIKEFYAFFGASNVFTFLKRIRLKIRHRVSDHSVTLSSLIWSCRRMNSNRGWPMANWSHFLHKLIYGKNSLIRNYMSSMVLLITILCKCLFVKNPMKDKNSNLGKVINFTFFIKMIRHFLVSMFTRRESHIIWLIREEHLIFFRSVVTSTSHC